MTNENFPLLGELPARAAERWPHQEAMVWATGSMDYVELDGRIDKVACGLMRLGVTAGDKVGLLAGNGPEYVVAIFALWRIRAVAVPLNLRYREADLVDVVRRGECKLLIMTGRAGPIDFADLIRRSLATDLEQGNLRTVVIGDGRLPGSVAWPALEGGDYSSAEWRALSDRRAACTASDLALIVFTSGTTGRPKGVMHDHSCVRGVRDRARLWGVKPGETAINYLPMFHLYSLSEVILQSVFGGCRQVIMERFDADAALDAIERESVNIIHGFETHYADLLNRQAERPRNVRSLRFGTLPSGMDTSAAVAVQVQRVFCPTVTGTSLSESWSWMCTCAPDEPEDVRCYSSGRPLPGLEVRLVDPATDKDVPIGTPGEMWFRGYSIMKGYLGDPRATADTIDADGWLHSGDQGVMRADGFLRFTGRYKEMLKVGGENVSPQGVEQALSELVGEILQVAVVGVPHERLVEVPVAYVVLRDGAAITEEAILSACKGKIASFKIPRRVVIVDALPQTASGKIQRGLIRKRAIEELSLLDEPRFFSLSGEGHAT
ncbi:class I adenylate-forming enzyme family protein [Burkholderia lata]|uniref:class I adenylate-forming enzyme family protein n=1 Tax=Burkholderia lata (strain ATCC 17760 / DSM 23089 / LMG 22485 / NCIMB 9086 / R18194 / 383) TaxID=482957 RepID=UPI0015818103|nr:class I adenylate-forming enzyme family protein [Burkholderia lata]